MANMPIVMTVTATAAFVVEAVTAQTLPAVMRIDVSGIVPATVQEAQERCSRFSQLLDFETATATTQQKQIFWETAVACMLASDTPVNGSFLQNSLNARRTETSALVGTAQATLTLLQLERTSPDNTVHLVAMQSPVVVGGNDRFSRDDGTTGSYNTPWGIFPVLGIYTAEQLQEPYIKQGGIYLGEISPVPYRGGGGGADRTFATALLFHDWYGQEANQALFTNPYRATSHGCIRVPATFLALMMDILTTDSSVLIFKMIPPLEAFPVTENNQR